MLASFLRDKKGAALRGGPSQGGNAQGGRQHRQDRRAMLHCTSYVAMHNKPESRSSQGLSCLSAASRMPIPDMKRPGAGPGLCVAQQVSELRSAAALIGVALGLDGPRGLVSDAHRHLGNTLVGVDHLLQ